MTMDEETRDLIAFLATLTMPIRETQLNGNLPSLGNGVVKVIKHADVVGASPKIETSAPPPVPCVDTVSPARVVGRQPAVPHVQMRANLPQIGNAIVCRVTVDVVESGWLSATGHFPNDAVREIPSPPDLAVVVSRLTPCSECRFPGVASVPHNHRLDGREHRLVPGSPTKRARCWVAFQKLVEHFNIWHLLSSHVVSPHVRGQGRALLTQRFRPVSFSRVSVSPQVSRGVA